MPIIAHSILIHYRIIIYRNLSNDLSLCLYWSYIGYFLLVWNAIPIFSLYRISQFWLYYIESGLGYLVMPTIASLILIHPISRMYHSDFFDSTLDNFYFDIICYFNMYTLQNILILIILYWIRIGLSFYALIANRVLVCYWLIIYHNLSNNISSWFH